MNKLTNVFKKAIILLTLIFFLVIGYNAILFFDESNYLYYITKHPEYIHWFVVIILFAFIITIFKIIDKLNDNKKKILKYVLLLLLIIGQSIILIDINVTPTTDSYMVIEQARALAFGIDKTIDYTSTVYFQAYTNNNFCVLLVILLTKFFNIFNLVNNTNYLTLFNIVLIDISIILVYKTAKVIKGDNFALKALLLCILNPFNYLFIHWAYTCTYSLPFTIGCIYIVLLLKKQNKINYRFVFLSIIFGIVGVVGYLIRPTVVIPIIAIFIVLIIYIIENYRKTKLFFLKYTRKICITIIIVIVISISTYSTINTSINKFATNNNIQFPIEHWIMMGLQGNGSYNKEAFDFAMNYKTTNEKREVIRKEIKNIWTEFSISELVNHFVNKLSVTWSDGISSYKYRIGYINKHSNLYQYLYGEKNDFISIYCQSFRILTILLVILSLKKQLNTNKKVDYNFLLTLTLFGAIVFYLIWESKNVYSLPFIQFMLLLSISPLDHILKYISSNISKKSVKNMGYLLIILTIVSFISLEESFTNKVSTWNDYQIDIGINYGELIDNVARKNKIIRQEFYATGDFNKISLAAEKVSDNDTMYEINIYTNNKKISSFNVGGENVIGKIDGKEIILDLGYQKIDNKKKYIIEIKPIDEYNDDSIEWWTKFSKATDQYEGNLKIDNKKLPNDLLIGVYNQYNSPYISTKKYHILLSIVVIIEFVITIYLSKETKKTK